MRHPSAPLFSVSPCRYPDQIDVTTVPDSNEYRLEYECLAQGTPPTGQIVTFVTHPSFTEDEEDAYELFAPVEQQANGGWRAVQTFYPEDLFTVAAIGDGGGTTLTLDLRQLRARKRRKR